MPLAEEPTIFVIDPDHAVWRTVKRLAKSKSLLVEAYGSAESFFNACDNSSVGCMLVDVAAPGIDGVDSIQQFARRGLDFAVVFLAADYDAATVVAAIKGGAVDFLEKPCTRPELWERAIEQAISRHLDHRKQRLRRAAITRRLSRLSPGENDVLEGLLAGKPHRQVATDLGVSIRTVEERKSRLMKKMEANSVAKLARMVLELRLVNQQYPAAGEPSTGPERVLSPR